MAWLAVAVGCSENGLVTLDEVASTTFDVQADFAFGVPDATGDGIADLILGVATTQRDRSGGRLARMQLYAGPIGDIDIGAPSAQFQDLQSSTPHRAQVVIGDVNGDGISDLATGWGLDQTPAIHFGPFDGPVAAADIVLEGQRQVVGIGDPNDDGFDDVALVTEGFLEVLHGPDVQRVATLIGDEDTRATEVLRVGDVTGDGVPDLIVEWQGCSVVAGPFTGDTALADVLIPLSDCPWAVGDLDGDGVNDLVVANPNSFEERIVVWTYGPIGGDRLIDLDEGDAGVLRPDERTRYASTLAAGDGNGDGITDLYVGDPEGGGASRRRVGLQPGTLSGMFGPFPTDRSPDSPDFSLVGPSEAALGSRAEFSPDLDEDEVPELLIWHGDRALSVVTAQP